MDKPSVADHTQLPVDTRTLPSSVENALFYPADSCTVASMTSGVYFPSNGCLLLTSVIAPVKQAETEAMSSAGKRIYLAVSSMDVEMVAAPGLEQTAADAAMDHSTDIQGKLLSIYDMHVLHNHFSTTTC